MSLINTIRKAKIIIIIGVLGFVVWGAFFPLAQGIVVDGEVTVKRLSSHAGQIRLLAENAAYMPIEIADPSQFFIEGHAVGVIRTTV